MDKLEKHMKKIAMICFSQTGYETGKRLAEELEKTGAAVELAAKSRYIPESIAESHQEWTEKQFQKSEGIVFIGACGIAVRSIAPFVADKKKDPAIIVSDECGHYVISLLSGHLGGANELAQQIADLTGGIPVITTATDVHKKFAVDVFAKKNQCSIFPMPAAKEFSAALLKGEPVGFYTDFPYEGALPEGICLCGKNGEPADKTERPKIGMAVSVESFCAPFPVTVHIVPPALTLGVGCKKGKETEEIERFFSEFIKKHGLSVQAFSGVATIDLKKEEKGLLEFAKKWKLPFRTYSAEALQKVPGSFSASPFVKEITGVDNVCERSCLLDSGGKLAVSKCAGNGVTMAAAMKDWRIHFE